MAAHRPSHHTGYDSARSDEPDGWWRFVCSTNHKAIGTLYLVFAIVAGLVGGFLPLAMNVAFLEPGTQISSGPHPFDVFVTGHGLIMVFFTVIPAMIGGFGNWFVPLMIGAPDMAFPRMNRISFWLLPLSFALLTLSITMEGGARGEVGGGWAVYVPLTTYTSQGSAMDLAIFSLHIAGGSLVLSAINFITTIFNLRAPEMTLHKMPLFIWSILVASFLLLLSLPVLAGTTVMVLANQHFGSLFMDMADGADPIPYPHLYWFFGHPEVYILILPGFGVVSQIVATFSKKPIFASLSVAYAMVAIGVISFVVWAQYLYTAGLAGDPRAAFILTTLDLAVLSGISIFCWIATMWAGALSFRAPMLWATGYMVLFAVGGVTGVVLANASGDAAVADTYYVVAHLHYVLSLGAVCAIFAGWYYWFPKFSGIMYNEALAKPHFWLTFVGVTLMALPGYLGLVGLEWRAADPPGTFARWNDLTVLGSAVLGAGVVVFLLCMVEAFFRKRPAGRNPWGAGATTLEWS